jgi:hypothetical protein
MKVYKDLVLTMDGKVITRSKTFNFLGLTLNETLTWNNHTSKLCVKIGAVVHVLHKLKWTLPRKILLMIYNALILSHLHYCNLLWGHSWGNLEELQMSALRAVTGYTVNSHSYQVCAKVLTLTVGHIHLQKLLILYKKIRVNEVPSNIAHMFRALRESTTRANPNVEDPPLPENKLKWLRYELPHIIKHNNYKDVINKIEMPLTMLPPSVASIKKMIKKAIILTYPTTCHLQECPTCSRILEDIFYPPRKKKNRKKKPPKKKCNPGCTCSIECRSKIIAQNMAPVPPTRPDRPFPLFLPNILVNNILNVPPPHPNPPQ